MSAKEITRQFTKFNNCFMASSLVRPRCTARLFARLRPRSTIPTIRNVPANRHIFSLLRRSKATTNPAAPVPILTEDNLFHQFSKSPFPAVRARGEAIKQLAPCPVCASSHDHVHAHTKAQPKAVSFECPDCGWPTHCSEQHWKEDEEHQKYCTRLREANEDEHDLRSGRRLREFELPGSSLTYDRHCNELTIKPIQRTSGLRGGHIICQLGCVLVYSWLPFHGHRTFP